MAWIQFHNTALQAYHNAEYMPDDYRITEISSEGVTQVPKEVADALVDADVASHYTKS